LDTLLKNDFFQLIQVHDDDEQNGYASGIELPADSNECTNKASKW
jgi:hypothetical protein